MSIKSKHQQRIERMMEKAGQELPSKPAIPVQAVRKLRAMLILEEALETAEALGFKVLDANHKPLIKAVKKGTFLHEEVEPDLIEIVDGCADISVVTIGTLSACGVSDKPILKEVDKNNLEKFGPGGYRNDHGKWVKPAGHQPPNILGRLEEQGYDTTAAA